MDLKTTIKEHISFFLRHSVYTACPAEVMSVTQYSDRQVISVKPSIHKLYRDGTHIESPTIADVPVLYPSGGGGLLSFPIKVGDTVLLVWSMRDMENWKYGDGSAQTAKTLEMFHIKDAIAIPCVYTVLSNLNPNPDNVELKFEDILFSLQPDNTASLTNGSVTLTLNPDGSCSLTNGTGTITLETNGEVNINGAIIGVDGSITSPSSVSAPSIVANSKELAGHTHSGVQSGGSNTGPNN